MAIGLSRKRNGWGTQASVLVRYDDGSELDIPEDQYFSSGYEPPFDDLPWSED
jgi:hypothetical protein